MHWWPMAASVSAAFFVVALAAITVAPAIEKLCGEDLARSTVCDRLLMAARSLVVGSGALLAAALVAGTYTVLLARAGRPRADDRPLVSIRARRRH